MKGDFRGPNEFRPDPSALVRGPNSEPMEPAPDAIKPGDDDPNEDSVSKGDKEQIRLHAHFQVDHVV